MHLNDDSFFRFEHDGWQRVAAGYDAAWNGLVRPFIPYLLDAARVCSGSRLLDVACGPGYAGEAALALGAIPTGLDFSAEMISIAKNRNPTIKFHEGDAQNLDFPENSFDAVVMNFGLLHLSRPEAAFAEAFRVTRPGGWYAFTIWAAPDKSPGHRIIQEAVNAHADFEVCLPEGPDYFAYGSPDQCRLALGRAGFDPASLRFQTIQTEWRVPSLSFFFESERDAGVRTAALLAAQKPKAIAAIKDQIEISVGFYAKDDGFDIPFTAHVVAVQAVC
jgi:SAM-dependent methyltransferase